MFSANLNPNIAIYAGKNRVIIVFPLHWNLVVPQELLSLAAFAFAASITPGPNNLLLLASGTNFGLRRSIPHLAGVALGFALMLILVGLGLGELFERFPLVATGLRGLCFIYLLYLAWRLAQASPNQATVVNEAESPAPGGRKGRPMSFLEAALFQWVNPKAWAMGLTAMSVYLPEPGTRAVLLVALVFALVNVPCISAWTVLGVNIRRWLSNSRTLVLFNRTMAVLLVLSTLPAIFA